LMWPRLSSFGDDFFCALGDPAIQLVIHPMGRGGFVCNLQTVSVETLVLSA
jgi:hypothetical protein